MNFKIIFEGIYKVISFLQEHQPIETYQKFTLGVVAYANGTGYMALKYFCESIKRFAEAGMTCNFFLETQSSVYI